MNVKLHILNSKASLKTFFYVVLSASIFSMAESFGQPQHKFNTSVEVVSFKPIAAQKASVSLDIKVATQAIIKRPETLEVFITRYCNEKYDDAIYSVSVPLRPYQGIYKFEYQASNFEIFNEFISTYINDDFKDYFIQNSENNFLCKHYLKEGNYTGGKLIIEQYIDEVQRIPKHYLPNKYSFNESYSFKIIDLKAVAKELLLSKIKYTRFTIDLKDASSHYPLNSQDNKFEINVYNALSSYEFLKLANEMIAKIFKSSFPESDNINRENLISEIIKDLNNLEFKSTFTNSGGSDYEFKVPYLDEKTNWDINIKITSQGYYFVNQKIIAPKNYSNEIEVLMEDVGSKVRISDNKGSSNIIVH